LSLYEKTVKEKVGRFPRWHAKDPASVCLDQNLSDAAVRVYDVMGLKTKGGVGSIGVRYLGRLLGRSRETVRLRIKELVSKGYLEVLPSSNGQRASYRFTSPAYQRVCRECHHFAHVGASGLCWICEELTGKEATA
jgi:hypothetical protein